MLNVFLSNKQNEYDQLNYLDIHLYQSCLHNYIITFMMSILTWTIHNFFFYIHMTGTTFFKHYLIFHRERSTLVLKSKICNLCQELYNTDSFTHLCLLSTKEDIGKQCRTRSEGSYESPLIWFCSVYTWKKSKIVKKS